MTAGLYDLTIEKGTDYTQVFTVRDSLRRPVDLTSYVGGCMDIRAAQATSSAILSFSTAASTMTLGGTLGTITIAAARAVTSAVVEDAGVYDLELTNDSGKTARYLEGTVTFVDEVTRSG